jgi:ribosomal protein L11 methyltransferase
MTDYQVFKINCPSNISEIVIAELADIGFEGFIENEQGFEAYMLKDAFDATLFYGICEKYSIGKDMVTEETVTLCPKLEYAILWKHDFRTHLTLNP